MASTQSSAQSSLPISQLIDQIINTKQDGPDFDLDQLITHVDGFLALCKANQGRSLKSKKSTVDWLPSASDAAKISEGVSGNVEIANQARSLKRKESTVDWLPYAAKISEGVSKNVKTIANQIWRYCGDKQSTTIAVLEAAGNIHWVGLGFLVLAAVLQRVDTIQNNLEECLDILSSMNDLAKVLFQLKEFPRAKDEMQTQINDSIAFIIEGAILCSSQKKTRRVERFFHAQKVGDDLLAFRSKMDEMYRSLILQINVQSLSILDNSLICKQPHIPSVKHAVGIQHQIDEVVKRLQWENDTPSVAVVVYGLGGSGKTTLADAVYDSLRDKLKGWKYSKITLIQNLEEHPNVEELQSSILQDLTGAKHDVRDFQSGQQSLKEIMEEESIFLYIDNALFTKPLQKLLPREITNPKKLRLLLTARKSIISDVMKKCSIKRSEIYPIDPLPLDAAIQVLCGEEDTNFLLKERPRVEVIAEKCSSCPLFLELVGGFLRRRRNEVEAYEGVLKWMENGEPSSGHSEDRFDEGRIMFAYEQLDPSAQEAFLDICNFFYNWKWEDVACIVGKEEIECLEEGALIRRKLQRYYQSESITEIGIHDLLLQVGRNKSKDNRFRTADDFTRALQDNEHLRQIKGVWLTQPGREFPGPIEVSAEVLEKMSGSLRVFAMGNLTFVEGKCSKSFGELRFLQVGEVPNLPMDISKLTRLTYMNSLSFKGTAKLSQLKHLSRLKVAKVSNPHDSWNSKEISGFGLCKEMKQLVLKGFCGTFIPCPDLDHLKNPNFSNSENLKNLSESLENLSCLEKLCLDSCRKLKQLPEKFGKLNSLVHLSLRDCRKLKELPMDFVELSSIRHLDLSYCWSLQALPSNFEKLTSLEYLNLRGCSGLVKLPERLGNLSSLRRIDFRGCENLRTIPQSLGMVTSLLTSDMSFDGCKSLRELPEETSWLSGMKKLSFNGCSSLKRMPTQFSKLVCLEELILEGCESIEELWNDFHGLEVLRILVMSQCRSLSTLPQGFGKLSSLQILNLSKCDKLEELSEDFHCLGALKVLNLSGCCRLNKLPDLFGQLVCLESVDLSASYNLAKLSDDFASLPSLIRLNVSKCKRLGGEWMDSVGATKSLWYVDISGSEEMIQRWMEMQREKEEWHLVVVTESSSKNTEGTQWSLILEKFVWKIFSEEGLLIDARQRPFYSSSLPSQARLILITQRFSVIPEKWRLVQSNLQRLECNSKASAIIYVGRQFNTLPSELADRIVAHSARSSGTESFTEYFLDVLPRFSSIGVFASSIDGVGRNTLKYLSTWEDISYILNEETIVPRNQRENNVEWLNKLFLPQETDFLLLNNERDTKSTKRRLILENIEAESSSKVTEKNLQSSSILESSLICNQPRVPSVNYAVRQHEKEPPNAFDGAALLASPPSATIRRVPEDLKALQRETYDPKKVGLGIYQMNSSEMEEYKGRALCITANRLKGTTITTVDKLVCNLVEEIQKLDLQIRNCYKDKKGSFSEEILAWNFAMDACFILEYFRSLCLFSDHSTEREIMKDIFKLENQIPLFILLRILELEFKSPEKAISRLADMLCMHPHIAILPFSLKPMELRVLQAEIEANIKGGACHLLHLLSKTIEAFLRPSNISTGDTVVYRDVDIVHELPIKFKPSIDGQVRFEKGWFGSGVLYLPRIYLLEETEPLLWNLIAFAIGSENIIGHFMFLMKCIICSNSKSVALLREEQIIISKKSDEEIHRMFNDLSSEISVSCGPFENVWSQVRKHCSSPFNRWINHLMPWLNYLLFFFAIIGFVVQW